MAREQRIYKNTVHGFEIELPDMWSGPGALTRWMRGEENPSLRCGPGEAFNFEIGPQTPEPRLEETEREFTHYARECGYTELKFGRIRVEGKEHIWARYRMPQGIWTKKYMVILDGIEYCVTASAANQQWLAQREPTWDKTVATFRRLR